MTKGNLLKIKGNDSAACQWAILHNIKNVSILAEFIYKKKI
jgi:hypothetical protein